MSAKLAGDTVDLTALTGASDTKDAGVKHGALLLAFAEAVMSRGSSTLTMARDALEQASSAGIVIEAAGVAANFQRMVRIADATGIPVDDMASELGSTIREELGLYVFEGAANSIPRP
ncbi:MAG: hypothetical protein P8N63_11335 [Pseudomonadales bacterium]|nr:hypothetical protein [Pseudomonadales bacterium]